ncbi:MAG: VanZ family protein [Actinobacteria bacterium]|nr:VanZ family protein [Actinomycetota bacterium]
MKSSKQTKFTFATILIFYIFLLLLFTLFPRPILESSDANALLEFLRDNQGIFFKILYADSDSVYVGNYFMFMPLAFLISLIKSNWSRVQRVLVIVCFSGTIEISQVIIPGRTSDLIDFLSNVFGGFLVILIFDFWRSRRN